MGIDPQPFCANLFLYIFESKYIKQLISNRSSKTYKFYVVSRFTDDLCSIKDGNKFLTSFNKYVSQGFRD